MKNKKHIAFHRGLRAESLAAWYLRLKCYSIVARRFKTRLGEIDIIAKRGNLVAIVEVKARPSLAQACQAVDKNSERRIEAAADLWLARQNYGKNLNLRFDVIIIRPWRWPHHIKAFFTSDRI